MKSRNPISRHVITAVLTLALAAMIAACSPGEGAGQTPSATVTLATTQPLQTYTNPTYGYSIDYPAELTLQAEQDEFVWLDGQIAILVSRFNPEEALGDGPMIESAEDVTAAGMNARRLIGYIGAVGGSTPQRYESVVIPHNDSFYVFTVYELKNDVALPADREFGDIPQSARDLFEQIISSIRFTA